MHKLGGKEKGGWVGGRDTFPSSKNFTRIKIIQWEQHEQIMHFHIRRVLKLIGIELRKSEQQSLEKDNVLMIVMRTKRMMNSYIDF